MEGIGAMERVYHIRRLPDDVPVPFDPDGVFVPENVPPAWRALEEAKLDCFPWERAYMPESAARVGWNEAGLHVLMYADEPTIRCEIRATGGDVFTDSCLEFFLAPVSGDHRYFNCEVNPLGVVHLGVGTGRYDRTVEAVLPAGMEVRHSAHRGGWWAVEYVVPAAFLREKFGVEMAELKRARGNFYKCGNLHIRHHGMFQPYPIEAPDFHRPEYFAPFVFE